MTESPGKENVFRKLVTTMLVAARRNNKTLDLKIITARLNKGLARGEGDPAALKAYVMAGLADAPATESEKPVKRWNPLGAR